MRTKLRSLVLAQEVVREIGLGERLTSRECETSTRSTVVQRVILDFLEHLLHGHSAARQHRRFTGAPIGTEATNFAAFRIYIPIAALVEYNRLIWTRFNAETAVEALVLVPNNSRRELL